MFDRILLAYDGSQGARAALARTCELVREGAEVHVLAVGRIPEYAETMGEVEEAKEQADRYYVKALEEGLEGLRRAGVRPIVHVEYGKPGEVIVRVAEGIAADLVVIGTNPHSSFSRRVLGSTADKVVDCAHCSVLVARSQA
jgi:nucleotide-binding universal stress UspA family protein